MNTLCRTQAGLRPIVAGSAIFAAAVLGSPAGFAQSAVEKPAAAVGLDNDILKARGQELASIRAEQQRAAETEAKLRAEIVAFGNDRRKLNTDLIGTAARLRDVETRLAATEGRLAPLEDQEQALHASLKERRGTIAEVLAALQRMGRRPPPALLVSPEDAATTLRSAIVLGAVVPELRDRATKVAADLGVLQKLRVSIANERAALSADLKALSDDQQRMSLLVEQRQKQQAESERALEQSRAQADTLSRQAETLQDLVSRLEQGLDNAARAARKVPESDQKGATRPALVALNDPGRMSPALSFASTRGTLRIPVNGVKIRDFGASDGIGGTERGISVATRPGAQVTSPCDGWVVYAGPFRSYGQLLILNAGGGYHVVIAGMDRISVDIGQFVLTGEPVAVMGSGTTQVATAASMGTSQVTNQPVLYVEFRKDGTPVDSGPWWAKKESEKVRG
jgi:septal ring factor EnvC (AmiA/AmiB activator)